MPEIAPDYVTLQASNLISVKQLFGGSPSSYTSLEQAFDLARKFVNKTTQRCYIQRGLKRLAEMWMDHDQALHNKSRRVIRMKLNGNEITREEEDKLGGLATHWRVQKWG